MPFRRTMVKKTNKGKNYDDLQEDLEIIDLDNTTEWSTLQMERVLLGDAEGSYYNQADGSKLDHNKLDKKNAYRDTKRYMEEYPEVEEELEEIEDFEDEEDSENEGIYTDDDEDYEDDEYLEEDEEYEDEEYSEDDEEYEDEEYSEDDEDTELLYLEDDDSDEDDRKRNKANKKGKKSKKGKKNKSAFLAGVATFFANMGTLDKVVAATGAMVLVVAILTISIYTSAKAADSQVASLAPVGEQLATIGIVGEDKMLAIADAQKAKLEVADATEETETSTAYEEEELTGNVQVVMNLTSVQKDLKIKFVNKKTSKLVSNVPFTVQITDSANKSYTKNDDDKDGIIYLKDLTPGTFTVAMQSLSDGTNYQFSTDKQSVEVKENIEYKKIDVADEVKAESQVNVAKEDTEVAVPVESALTDTVAWVDSTKTVASGSADGYEEVGKSNVTDPSTIATAIFMKMSSPSDNNTAVTGISISPSSISALTVGNTTTLSATVEPSNATNKEVTWTSSDDAVASVSGGVVTGKKAGSVTITAKAGDKNATCSITVKDAVVDTLSLDKTTATVTVGSTVAITATSNNTVSWTTSDATVASVTSSGVVSGVKAGTATITAKAGSKTVTCAVTVTAQDTLTLDKTTASVTVGSTVTITATSNNTVTWSGSDTTIATVSTTGVVTGVKAGTATITAKAGTKTVTCTVTVTAQDTLTLDKTTASVIIGSTVTITATSNNTVTWSSSDTAIATVSATGVVTGVKAGTATITAKAGAKTVTCTVTVTASSTLTLNKTTAKVFTSENVTITSTSNGTVTWSSSDTAIATVNSSGVVTGVKAGSATITATVGTVKVTCAVTVKLNPKSDTTSLLKDNSGNQLYIKNSSGAYVKATYADYYNYNVFYKVGANAQYKYTGWQTIDNKTYFFDANGNKITGEQVIQGAKYTFSSDGALVTGSGTMGIDVSKWNGSINWDAVKNSGISYVIIRCGYRGSTTGALIQDPKFAANIQGAANAGIKVGIYFFTQAVNEVEAVEEASMTIGLIKNYKISYPVFLDVEGSGGRGDTIDAGTRTSVINAYCQTIKNSGYTAGVYANKTWLSSKINTGSLGGNKVWLAQYSAAPSYSGKFDMWQYTSKGSVSGISGSVDMNISYLGY